jgi:hypothetical protein
MVVTENLMSQLREDCEIILSAIIFAQKGTLLPQVITRENIIQAFQKSHSVFPADLSLPTTASVACEYVLMVIIDTDVFLIDNILGYILRIPLVNSVVYNLYKMIPFPTKVKNSRDTFVFIGTEKNYLLMDTLKQSMLNLVN